MKKKNYNQVKRKIDTIDENNENQITTAMNHVIVGENGKAVKTDEPIELETISGLKDQTSKVLLAILITSLLGMVLCGFMDGTDLIKLVKNSLLVVILDFILVFYVQINKEKILFPPYTWWFIGLSYLVSILLLCNPYELSLYPFWLIGIVFIAAYVNANFSLIFCYGLIVISMVTGTFDMNTIVIHILLGTFICLMARYLTRLSQLCYALVLVISMNITLLFIINSFKLENVFNQSLVWMLIADISVLGIVYLAKLIAPGSSTVNKLQADLIRDDSQLIEQGKNQSKEPSSVPIMEQEDGIVEQVNGQVIKELMKETMQEAMQETMKQTRAKEEEENEQAKVQAKAQVAKLEEEVAITKEKELRKTKLLAAIAPEAYLLVQMKSESEKLYHHSMVVANLSKRAALSIGANAELACAGGWYHEIGRLTGKDYILHGVTLIQEHQLPSEIADIIIQHNFKQQLPQTVEAAIVMLTDNIVSTIQYVKNHMETHITPDKVIENAFLVRMNKGVLNEAKMTVAEFTKLKEFYLSIIEEFR